jgi:pimeloyl-ACP methyl ester carboxylesterase
VNGLWLVGVAVALPAALVLVALWYLRWRFLGHVVRIVQERPLFVIPRGEPFADGEEVHFRGPEGRTLHGRYLPTPAPRRRGVVLFGLEFGSTCEACQPYCADLRAAGFDVFTFEPCNQGASGPASGYEPLQWVTRYEVADFRAALAYLRSRHDAGHAGVGVFGISKGAGAALLAAADDPYVRCAVTDGAFALHTTMLPYMRKWVSIYCRREWVTNLLPTWVYVLVGRWAIRRVERDRNCRFPHLERVICRLAPRPLLMIHGGEDAYIKPEMARALFERAGEPKDFWLVEGAKHNQALHVAGGEYRRRVRAFFEAHLAADGAGAAPEPHRRAEAAPALQR